MSDYEVTITFKTTVSAPDDEVAKQAARHVGSGMANDSANSHYDYVGTEVTEVDE